MKRFLLIALALISSVCSAQTFKIQNLDVLGTSTLTGLASFTVRPQFNGNTPWDSGNFNPSSYLTTAAAASTYAPIASPTFTGTVTIPAGASISGYAPLASPAFTGTPTAPTPATGTNNTQIATMHALVAHAPCQSIIDYGGNNGGVVDNTAALAADIAAQPAGKVCVYFPAGTYAFASANSYTIPAGGSITMMGAGPDVTNLVWASNGGLTLSVTDSFASFHIRDLSFLAGQAGGGGAITLDQVNGSNNPANTAPSDITNVTFRGSDGYLVTNYWTTAIVVNGVSTINFVNLFVTGQLTGNGVLLQATPPYFATVYNFTGCTFNYTGFGIIYGTNIQGVTVNQSNFVGSGVGIYVGSSTVGTSELLVLNSQFGNLTTSILLMNGVPGTVVMGSLFYVTPANASGITIVQPGLYQIIGNTFIGDSAAGSFGILFQGPSGSSGTITGNTFFKLPVGISLDAATAGVNVQSNAYNVVTTPVANSGSNTIGGGSQ